MLITEYARAARQWWNSIDHYVFISVISLMIIGIIMAATASPAVAERIGLTSFYFFKRQVIFTLIGIIIMIIISITQIRLIVVMGFVGLSFGILLLIYTLIYGVEIKGAHRWLSIGGFSIQASEFLKPFFIIVTAWILNQRTHLQNYPSFTLSLILYLIICVLLLLQPDFGMMITYTLIWGSMIFLAGLSILWILAGLLATTGLVLGAYSFLPHVAKRIDKFFDPDVGANYQVSKALEAFRHGKILGVGPGEGIVKAVLPDSHTDFIFAVIGEEFGLIPCLLVIVIFGIIILRGFYFVARQQDWFVVYCTIGLLFQIAIQSMINIGVNIHILPTKGMTLPFISYGGSSIVSASITIGILLSIMRKKKRSFMVSVSRNNNPLAWYVKGK